MRSAGSAVGFDLSLRAHGRAQRINARVGPSAARSRDAAPSAFLSADSPSH